MFFQTPGLVSFGILKFVQRSGLCGACADDKKPNSEWAPIITFRINCPCASYFHLIISQREHQRHGTGGPSAQTESHINKINCPHRDFSKHHKKAGERKKNTNQKRQNHVEGHRNLCGTTEMWSRPKGDEEKKTFRSPGLKCIFNGVLISCLASKLMSVLSGSYWNKFMPSRPDSMECEFHIHLVWNSDFSLKPIEGIARSCVGWLKTFHFKLGEKTF